MSIRLQIRDQIIAELNTAPPVGVPEATKRRWVPGQQLREPRLAVFFGPTETLDPPRTGFPLNDRTLIVSIQAAVAVEDPASADDEVEPLLAHVVKVLGNTSLNKLATKVEEQGTEWASGQAGLFYHAGITRYAVRFQTRRGDLTEKQ